MIAYGELLALGFVQTDTEAEIQERGKIVKKTHTTETDERQGIVAC